MYRGKLRVWKQAPYSQTLGSFSASMALLQLKPSFAVESLSALRRAFSNARSSSLIKLALDGQSAMYHHPAMARTIVSKPSMMNIHLADCQSNEATCRLSFTNLHPLKPPTPLMKPMPYAKIPPKAPAREAALKKSATRY